MTKQIRTKKDKLNRNSAINQFSNFLLATSLALTGTALVEFFTKAPRFTVTESILCVIAGSLALAISCGIHFLKEDPDAQSNDDSG